MKRILLIEEDEKLLNSLAIEIEDDFYELECIGSYADAVKLMSASYEQLDFDAVVLGWCRDSNDAFPALKKFLCNDNLINIPIQIISDTACEDVLTFSNSRKNNGLLLWDSYKTFIKGHLQNLIDRASGRSLATLTSVHQAAPIRILFVDDSATVRKQFSTLLARNGYEAVFADDIDQAFDIAKSSFFDIAIIDYYLEKEVGSKLCRKLRDDKDTKDIVRTILTTSYQEEVVLDGLESGAIDFMFKNESENLFLARLSSISKVISASKQTRSESKRLLGILESVSDGVFGIDHDMHITFMNSSAKEILGLEDDVDLLGSSIVSKLHLVGQEKELDLEYGIPLFQAHKKGHFINKSELMFVKSNGKKITVECDLYPLEIDGNIEGSVIAFRDVSEKKLFQDELRWQANHDSLTKLLNRHYFEQQLEQEVSRKLRHPDSDEISALLYFDLDQFKYLNDTAGHVAGDQLLVEVGHQLQTNLRSADTLARLGGDEFAIILRDIKLDEVATAADRFREILEKHCFQFEGKAYSVSVSIGGAIISGSSLGAGEVLANADVSCHIAKNKGRNQSHIYDPASDARLAMDKELGWSTRLRDALGNDKFELVFQPIVPLTMLEGLSLKREGLVDEATPWPVLNQDGKKNQVVFEVLLRLTDEGGKIVAPDMFLPTAERFNMMPEIDRWVVRNSLKRLSLERTTGRDIRFTINLSGSTMVDKTIGRDIKEMLQEYEIAGDLITFEITETCAITNIDAANKLISELKEVGCQFALDDFGSGFSSFGHLKHLDIDYVKIDGMFIQGIISDSMDKAVVQSINQIAHSFNKKTVAEYVDNSEIVEVLEAIGIDYAQGYFVSKPKPTLGF
ncbi:MAG: GGDEF domain-containing response regulator [Gammaproteobacteria bacterium]|nr:MAG: GGDEF domain-containing response regulator [Gammaproteobacteria bacterium]